MEIQSRRVFHFLEIFSQLMLLVFVFLIIWEVFKMNLNTLHSWHIILSVSGIALYVAEGVQLFRRVSLFFEDTDRINRVLPHGVVMALGVVNITIGIALKISQKQSSGGTHFQSTHAIIGLVAWIVIVMAAFGGIFLAKFSYGNARLIKLCHIILGISAYILGVLAIGYGLNYLVNVRGRNALIVFMSIYVAYSLIGPCTTLINLFK